MARQKNRNKRPSKADIHLKLSPEMLDPAPAAPAINPKKPQWHMSLNSWRFKLLHWVLGAEQGVKDSDIERNWPALYTAYCPLFWLTTFMFLFLPIIIPVKGVCWVFKKVHGLISDLFTKLEVAEHDRLRAEILNLTIEQEEALIRDLAMKWMKAHSTRIYGEDDISYHGILGKYQAVFKYHDYVSGRLIIQDQYRIFLETKALVEAEQKAVRTKNAEKLAFFITAFKFTIWIALYSIYAALGLGLLYGVVTFGPGAVAGLVDFVTWLWTQLWAEGFATRLGQAVLSILGIFTTIMVLSQFLDFSRVYQPVTGRLASGCRWCGKGLSRVAEEIGHVIAMLYEDNCPRIVLKEDQKNDT